jgi:hypothetical protein
MWHSARGRLGHVRRVRWLAVALTVGALGFAGCGDDSGSEGETTAAPTVAGGAADLGESGDPILIETQVTLPTGKVLPGSLIGDSSFCRGGSFRDEHGDESVGLVVRTFTCPEGSLKIGFSPMQQSLIQSTDWHVLSGSGRFEALRGGGWLVARIESQESLEGQETFTGTVAR